MTFSPSGIPPPGLSLRSIDVPATRDDEVSCKIRMVITKKASKPVDTLIAKREKDVEAVIRTRKAPKPRPMSPRTLIGKTRPLWRLDLSDSLTRSTQARRLVSKTGLEGSSPSGLANVDLGMSPVNRKASQGHKPDHRQQVPLQRGAATDQFSSFN